MELFVINRHTEEKSGEPPKNDEQAKLTQVQKRIERNQKQRAKLKESVRKRKEIKNTAIVNRLAISARKKAKKALIVPLPSGDDDFLETAESYEDDKKEKPEPEIKVQKKTKKIDPSTIEGFTILGGDGFDKKSKVKSVLPRWLSNPSVISVNLQQLEVKVSDMKQLDKSLRKKLKSSGIKYFFPVQAQVIPWVLEANQHSSSIFPRDICVSAPTGSGKTLAFTLPIVQMLQKYTVREIRALVILPTQDLAMQVFKCFREYTAETNLHVSLITGKSNFTAEQNSLVVKTEAFGYLSRVDILVCTAGRLVDHLKYTTGLNLTHLEFLIIDEADRVLEIVQSDWLYHLEKHIYSDNHPNKPLNLHSLNQRRPPQKLLFSATLSQDPEKLQKLSLFQPKLFTSIVENSKTTTESNLEIENSLPEEDTSKETENSSFIGKYTTPNELTEKYIISSAQLKPLVLYKFILTENLGRTLIFSHSLDSVHRLTMLLRLLFKSERKIEEISSNLTTQARNTLIERFSKGDIDILVCTDSLTRGIDLPSVKCVISYSSPQYIKTYIHRAGRTARAGEPGLAVTMLLDTHLSKFKNMLQQAGKTSLEKINIIEEDLLPLESQYKDSLEALKSAVKEEDTSDMKRIKTAKQQTKRKREMMHAEKKDKVIDGIITNAEQSSKNKKKSGGDLEKKNGKMSLVKRKRKNIKV